MGCLVGMVKINITIKNQTFGNSSNCVIYYTNEFISMYCKSRLKYCIDFMIVEFYLLEIIGYWQ